MAGSLALVVAACGGGAAERPPAESRPTEVANEKPTDDTAPATVQRSTVKAAMARGLGAFLADVVLDDRPVFREGKFYGFRLVAIKGALQRSTLLPGDVLLRVNGMPVERPEQALSAFRSIEVASEIRIDIERKGEPKAVRFAIVEDEIRDGGTN